VKYITELQGKVTETKTGYNTENDVRYTQYETSSICT